ncbi:MULTISPECIES: TerD family protein [unclassified Streptomyces]|uniref:TerD family protein n=1 Tax=unclassified Streptomyces TaxID=2593676 RepID=UPI001F51FC3B|nr:TerD family protein [Streptomyces sp. TSRI0107]
MTHITKGANTPVPAGLLRVAVCRHKVAGTPAVDVSALLLDAAGKVRGDADLVFRDRPAHPSGAVRHVGTGDSEKQLAEWLELDLPRVEPAVQRVLVAASCAGGTFGAVPGLAAQTVAPDGTVLVHYEVTDAATETAFVLGEFYRRDGQWKFRAVGQGYDSGLAGLATDFGIAAAQPAAPRGPVPNTGVSKVAGPPPGALPLPGATRQPGAMPEPKATWEPGATREPARAAVEPAGAAPATKASPASSASTASAASPASASPASAASTASAASPARKSSPTRLGEDFRPWTRSGRGERVVSVKLPAGPVIVEGRHDGEGLFCVDTLDDDKQPDRLVLNSARPRFRGRGLATVPADRRLRLRVQFHGDWEIAVRPLSAARALRTGEEATGSGPEVLRYDGPAADLRARFDGGRNSELFCVHSHEPDRLNDLYDYKLLVNELGRVDRTAPLPRGPLLVTVANGEGDWRLQATPIPVRGGSAAPADGVYEGRGDTTVTLVSPRPGHPALLEYEIGNADDRGHEVILLDEYGDSDGEWMNGSRHGERGSHVLFAAGQAQRTLQIRRAGKWRLRVLPIEEAPLLNGPVEGTGSTLLRYQGPPTLLRLGRTSEEAGYLAAHALNHPRGQRTLIADTDTRRRPVVGPVWVAPEGSCFVRVQAGDGVGWRVEPVPLDEAPVIGGGTERVTGRGFGVVRHTGPETEMLLTHDYDMLSDLIHLFELDENLFPVRHIGRSRGRHRLPNGFLQIRGFGEWGLEQRR